MRSIDKTIIFAVLASLLFGCAHSLKVEDEQSASEEQNVELYFLHPHLFHLQKQFDRANAYYHLGDLESCLFLTSDLLATVGNLSAESSTPEICEYLERLEIEIMDLRHRVLEGTLWTYTRENISAVIDSIARNHVVEEEMEVVLNWKTERFIKYFTGKGKRHFRRWLQRLEKYRDTIEPVLVKCEVPRDIIYLAVIESGLNFKARSNMEAVGPWQFMAGTARVFGLRINWWIDERRDIVASTYAAAHYLKHLHNIFGDWKLALAGYNAGEYRVAYAISRQKTDDFWRLRLPSQTRWFVPKYMAALEIGRNPGKYGFMKSSVEPYRFDTVTIRNSTSLRTLAKAAGCTVMEIKNLNPAFKRWATPPDMEVEVKIPPGTREKCLAALASIPPSERVSWHRHTLRRGETLSQLSSRYDISVAELQRINKIGNPRRMRAGKLLMIPVKDANPSPGNPIEPSYQTAPDLPEKITIRKHRAPSGHKKIIYTVKDNDTLSEIADRAGVGLSRLRGWNDLRYSHIIHPGEKLVIYLPPGRDYPPEGGNPADRPDSVSPGSKKIIHIVEKGETLSSISRNYRTRISDILSWNRGIDRNRLFPGDRITIWTD